MDNDFNPFDLSAAPKKVEEPEKPATVTQPKPTVKKVSMGPVFHSRITKFLAFILGMVLAALIGYTATNYYLTQKDEKAAKQSYIRVDA